MWELRRNAVFPGFQLFVNDRVENVYAFRHCVSERRKAFTVPIFRQLLCREAGMVVAFPQFSVSFRAFLDSSDADLGLIPHNRM